MDLKRRLNDKLDKIDTKHLSDFHVVLLPDFFVDHVLTMEGFETVFSRIKDIYRQGGGNVPGVSQRIHQGGNAANTALALSRMGVKSHLICRTDELGFHLLKLFLGKFGVDLKSVKTDGKLAVTTAMEFGDERVNVMVGDIGSVSDFTFESLDESDLQVISNADIVCVVNWTLNQGGTELAKNVFKYAKKHDVKTFFDTGDPAHREKEIPELKEKVLRDKNLDILGLNENELMHYSDLAIGKEKEDLVKAAVSLNEKLHARIDLHTKSFACTVNKKNVQVIPTLRLSKIYRATGAGDVWNAGDLFAELLDFDDDERLLFANVAAGCYISSPDPKPPSLDEILVFLKKIKKKF
jgi:sugar/nucleoside kinase (ribokinase family)